MKELILLILIIYQVIIVFVMYKMSLQNKSSHSRRVKSKSNNSMPVIISGIFLLISYGIYAYALWFFHYTEINILGDWLKFCLVTLIELLTYCVAGMYGIIANTNKKRVSVVDKLILFPLVLVWLTGWTIV